MVTNGHDVLGLLGLLLLLLLLLALLPRPRAVKERQSEPTAPTFET
jgi:hypothetical protein